MCIAVVKQGKQKKPNKQTNQKYKNIKGQWVC